MQRTAYNKEKYDWWKENGRKNEYANSTCLTRCDNGWTRNGNPEHICERCDERCRSCEDQGVSGDKSRCLACSTKYPFLYGPAKTCLEECVKYEHEESKGGVTTRTTKGLYMVNSQSCGVCDSACLACYGDKFNCTKCDSGQQKALFQQELMVGGRPTLQGTCAK